jgi:hypothetical protein
MTNEKLLNIIKKSVKEIGFAESFFQLCNEYNDYENRFSVKNADVKLILNEINFDMKNSAKESLFYTDYEFLEFKLRFILPYKTGFIDCSYLFWNDDNSIRIYGGNRENFKLGNATLIESLNNLMPIATSLINLKIIITKLIDLHLKFMESFESNLTKF